MVAKLKDGLKVRMYPGISGGYSGVYTPSFDVYGLWGQSNMIGRADIRVGIDDVYTDIAGKVFQYTYHTPAIVAATNPLDHYNSFAGDMGLWLEFCKARLSSLTGDRRMLVVPVARGGTSFAGNYWNPPSDSCYANAVANTNAAMAAGIGNSLKGILWLQGESDADAGATAAGLYQSKLQAMYNAMLTSVTGMTSTTPFIVGSIKPDKPQANVINAALQAFAAANPVAVKYVSLVDQTFIDSDHYTAVSLAVAGQRFASKF